MSDVTSREIMQATGITNVATLVRWHGREGLIPPPEIRTHPNGRGKMAYWPEWVLHRCVQIKQLRNEGQSLAQIREFFGSDWKTAERQYVRRYRYSDVSRKLDESAARDNMQDTIVHFLLDWMRQQQTTILKAAVPTIAQNSIEKAIAMLEDGINPVFILTGDTAILTADFAVSLQLAKCCSVGESFMVIPVRKELSAYLSKLATIPEQPLITPCEKVVRRTNMNNEEAKVVVMDSWEFELEPSKRRSNKRSREDS